jgi:hypothetical protein
MKTEQYVLEWSRKTNNFHVQPLVHSLASAQRAFLKNSSNDYHIIMVGTQDACLAMAENNLDKLNERKRTS